MEKQLEITIRPRRTGKIPRSLYRVYQFFQALTAQKLTLHEKELISSLLTASQQTLFQRMITSDQRHSLHVMQTLAAKSNNNPDLLVAALLHDVGKSFHPLRLWERPVVVLIRHYRPGAAVRWGRQPGVKFWGWKRPFVIYEQHPEWGAKMAKEAGCSPLTIWLIRWHHSSLDGHCGGKGSEAWHESSPRIQDESIRKSLLALQWADSIN
jgi:hypothetical protein